MFYFLVTGAVGLILTVVFQLAHCVGEAEFPVPSAATHQMPDAWAVHQVVTTVNFSRRSRLVSWFLGGLNFQIEHHLFPSMPRPNLRRSQQLVRTFCRRHGVAYCETTLLRSYAQALRHLHDVGQAVPATSS